ncbi:hypothetical protein LTR33_016306 [Friedmanniomyces endolithicus]|nr:hypothetical protein LTR33_016306 [Friedmanniomyces endolithicus]
MLKSDPDAKDGCRAPRPGEIKKNPTLANTFKLVGKHKKAGFYTGSVAEALVKVVQDLGGHLTLDDLKKHMELGTEETEPISLKFRAQDVAKTHGQHMHDSSSEGVEVWEHPPNGQGIVALMALGMLEELEKSGQISKWKPEDHNSAPYLHAVVETLRIAFADANWWVADPKVAKVPTKGLIDPTYLAERAKLFSPDKASAPVSHGSPAHSHSDTVYFAATDSEGNGISFINSNYGGFGTCIIPKGCGFTLQNRGANFVLQPADHPNILAPNKRPYHTIIPALVTNVSDGSLHSVYGVMGGFMQPQGHVQVLLNQLVFGLTPQAALDSPRVCIGAGMPEAGDVFDRTVYVEEGMPEATVKGLKDLGDQVEVVKGMARGLFGRGQVIRWSVDKVEGKGVWSAGSDNILNFAELLGQADVVRIAFGPIMPKPTRDRSGVPNAQAPMPNAIQGGAEEMQNLSLLRVTSGTAIPNGETVRFRYWCCSPAAVTFDSGSTCMCQFCRGVRGSTSPPEYSPGEQRVDEPQACVIISDTFRMCS